jgi:ABC-type nitrate/sulfonate/bicarbonate transport system substrate-binding protein
VSARLRLALLRGVCQIPAYVAHDEGLFAEEGLDVDLDIAATAWLVPRKLAEGQCQFAVMPWTRVAAAEEPLVLLCGSGREEAAIVMRDGIAEDEVRRVVVPLRGGIKDLTAMGLIRSLGWDDVEVMRQPSGDGAIISFFGQGADAASMVEPYAAMMEALGIGRVIRRTGDLWSGAPGCSLTGVRTFTEVERDTTERVVRAFVRGIERTASDPERAASIATSYIGIHERFIRAALDRNRPAADAIRSEDAMREILELMVDLGYVAAMPEGFIDLSFLDSVTAAT